ncbi:uncharacterized protein [Mobula birostris]|uniref:uncharacterized protein isoform X2 n=1 Tax=Mobula birostris TaxID=1983395 RepID=UPI003B287671
MARDPTYTNFHVAHGSGEDENVYSNFCNHQRGSAALQGKQGWRREVTCGGWTILCGRACIIYSIVAIIFLITLFLLISCLAYVKNLKIMMAEIEDTHNEMERNITVKWGNLAQNQETFSSMEAKLNATMKMLTQTQNEILSMATGINNTLSDLNRTQEKISSMEAKLNATMKMLNQTQNERHTDLQNMNSFTGKCCLSLDESGCCNAGKQSPSIKIQIAVDNKGMEQVCSRTKDSTSVSTETQPETTSVSSVTTTSLDQGSSKTEGN